MYYVPLLPALTQMNLFPSRKHGQKTLQSACEFLNPIYFSVPSKLEKCNQRITSCDLHRVDIPENYHFAMASHY